MIKRYAVVDPAGTARIASRENGPFVLWSDVEELLRDRDRLAAVVASLQPKPIANEERSSGRTWRQIENAPKNAVFIWGSYGGLWYPRNLAKTLGRNDLTIVSPAAIDTMWSYGKFPIVVDHAAVLSDRQLQHLKYFQERNK